MLKKVKILTVKLNSAAMFMHLLRTKLEDSAGSSDAAGPVDPPPTYIPPMGASAATWPNILKNKSNIDYCVEEFHYLITR